MSISSSPGRCKPATASTSSARGTCRRARPITSAAPSCATSSSSSPRSRRTCRRRSPRTPTRVSSVKLALTDAQEQKLFWVNPERRMDAYAPAAEGRCRQPRGRRVLLDAPADGLKAQQLEGLWTKEAIWNEKTPMSQPGRRRGSSSRLLRRARPAPRRPRASRRARARGHRAWRSPSPPAS